MSETEIVEEIAEAVEERVSWLVQNPKTVALIAGLGGLALGVSAGVFLTRKRLSEKYQQIADEQVASVKEQYAVIRKEEKSLEELAAAYPDEEKAADQSIAEKIISDEGYTQYKNVPTITDTSSEKMESVTVDRIVTERRQIAQAIEVKETELTHHNNVFESDDPETYFDWHEELERRKKKPLIPFVITKEEFDNNETDFDQSTLTYFDGDDVLADDQNSPVDNLDSVIGYENLLRFGHASGDRNVVYVRNAKLKLDFEVLKSEGKFAKEVLGYDDELRHEHKRPMRKMRLSDE